MTAQLSPDCRVGKCRACAGDSWDVEHDRGAACPCSCHDNRGTETDEGDPVTVDVRAHCDPPTPEPDPSALAADEPRYSLIDAIEALDELVDVFDGLLVVAAADVEADYGLKLAAGLLFNEGVYIPPDRDRRRLARALVERLAADPDVVLYPRTTTEKGTQP